MAGALMEENGMTKVYVSAVIDAPVEKVWAKVRDFNGLPDWHPRFSRSHIEDGLPSDKIGCVRNFDIAGGGGTIRERLLTLSDLDYTFTYCILTSPLPVEGYVATLKLHPITVGNKNARRVDRRVPGHQRQGSRRGGGGRQRHLRQGLRGAEPALRRCAGVIGRPAPPGPEHEHAS